ncbi:MAG TPA: hypothetical protein VN512_07870 [Clostridia bacterium]|nr:hypothetical protein [Clostridia bacterium]
MAEKIVFDAEDIQNNKGVAAVANIPILFWLPLVTAKDSAFAKFYANQGLLFLIASIILPFLNIIPILGQIAYVGCGIALLVFIIMNIIAATNGEAKEAPVFGSIKILN